MPQQPDHGRRGRRRRPGRRPPDRLAVRYSRPEPGGFTGHGLGAYYRLIMPALGGREKREFFNRVAGGLVAGVALGGAVLGFAWLGPLGAVVGLMAGGSCAEKGRFYRR